MAKLTLSFKDRLLSVHHLGEKRTTIGRDPDSGIRIDSLAVAPRHAELVPAGPDYLLLALQPEFPVRLNGVGVEQAMLSHGDEIGIGKHRLSYSAEGLTLPLPTPGHAPGPLPAEVKEEDDDEGPTDLLPAYLQVQSGRRIGQMILCRRAATRLAGLGAAEVIVTREGERYHLLRLDGAPEVRLGGRPIASQSEVRLADNDLIELGELRLRFYAGRASRPSG